MILWKVAAALWQQSFRQFVLIHFQIIQLVLLIQSPEDISKPMPTCFNLTILLNLSRQVLDTKVIQKYLSQFLLKHLYSKLPAKHREFSDKQVQSYQFSASKELLIASLSHSLILNNMIYFCKRSLCYKRNIVKL